MVDHCRNQWRNQNNWRQLENEKTMIQIVGSSKRSSKREDYTGIILPLERRKISNKQSYT